MFPYGVIGMLQASLIVFLAFLGFEAITSVGEEIKNPHRNLPLSILLTLVIIAAIYISLAVVAVGTTPWEAIASSEAPLAYVANSFIPGLGAAFIAASGVLMCLAIMNVVILLCSRIAFAMARDGLFPKQLVRTHPKFGTPCNAVLIFGIVLITVLLLTDLNILASVTGVICVVMYALINLAVIPLRRRETSNHGFKVPLYPATPILGAALLTPLLINSDSYSYVIILVWTSIGLVYYFAKSRTS